MVVNKAVIGGIIAAIVIAITVGLLSTGNLDSEMITTPLEETPEPIEESVPSETKSFTVKLEENVGLKANP